MAAERSTPPPLPKTTPPPTPKARKGRPRRDTQEILPEDMKEIVVVVDIVDIVDEAKTLLLQRISNKQEYLGKEVPHNPDQIKLSVLIELSKIRRGMDPSSFFKDRSVVDDMDNDSRVADDSGLEPISFKERKKIEEMMDLELRKAGIRE